MHQHHPDPTIGKGWIQDFFSFVYSLDVLGIAFPISFHHSLCDLSTMLQVDPVSAGAQYDKEFIVCSLDLLSGLAEGLGSGIESLVFSLFHIYIFLFLIS